MLVDSETGLATVNELTGTMGYFAPEQKVGAQVSAKIDMWALGICMYEMAVGYKPNVLDKMFVKKGEVPFREQDWASWSTELKDFVSDLLQVDPA